MNPTPALCEKCYKEFISISQLSYYETMLVCYACYYKLEDTVYKEIWDAIDES